ncbi:MAG TPA: hypothetical protein VGP76_00995 [Planctomycetaceae bacterium]|jgi:hypothetical protein|nr:hypothetical protein [Planctomycetaceae bacterium]
MRDEKAALELKARESLDAVRAASERFASTVKLPATKREPVVETEDPYFFKNYKVPVLSHPAC